ncbi:methyl-accepting chemotaxis protein [Sulfuricella sp.]|uniref:methyl-accepting chemotaxis protein n=1 Tax=Sulfuricella sp. TaxID=2099377 RepID=UPI002BAEAB52|nr:methyl-accepting chemotaxis protein [Sulfuricella sp.]HUX62320.1 methyl-accepting chemotaxis protein [Sulfuricella sp.]
MFKNMTVAVRLGAIFSLLGFGLVIGSGIALWKIDELKNSIDKLAYDRVPKILLAKTVTDNVNQNMLSVRNILLMDKEEDISREMDSMAKSRKIVVETIGKLEKTVTSEKDKQLLTTVKEQKEPYRLLVQKVLGANQAGKKNEATDILNNEIRPVLAKYTQALNELSAYQVEQIDNAAAEAQTLYQRTFLLITIAASALVIAVAIAGFLIIRSLTRDLGGEPAYAAEIARSIAAGNLAMTVVTKPNDSGSMLAAMKQMQTRLKEMVAGILADADQVSSTATELAAASSQVAESSRQQSEAASSMAAAVEEMTVSIDQVSENADEARTLSKRSGELSEQGAGVIQNAATEMSQISDSVKESSQIIAALEQQSGEISSIVNVIKEIADQTNLLALNAAIEAARAGEQGRGFAVVADEVRKLAERTSKSTQEIAVMIEKIQGGTHSAFASMESGVARVSNGVTLANEAAGSITQIKTEAARVVQVVGDISNSLKEQSVASNDIAKNVEKIAQMSEENSAAVQETAKAAQHLEHLATSMQNTIGRFKV